MDEYIKDLMKKVEDEEEGMNVDLLEELPNHCKLPIIILDIMNWFAETRFYKKTLEKRASGEAEVNWWFVDFWFSNFETYETIRHIQIGEIAKYQHDHSKYLYIDFNDINNCYLYRGYAVAPYAGKVIGNEYPIPKYMYEDLKKWIEEYNKVFKKEMNNK